MKKLINILILINSIPIGLTLIGLINNQLINHTSIDITKVIGYSYLIGIPIPIVIYLIFKVCKLIK